MQAKSAPPAQQLLSWAIQQLGKALDTMDLVVDELAGAEADDLSAIVLSDYHAVEATRRIVRSRLAEMRSTWTSDDE